MLFLRFQIQTIDGKPNQYNSYNSENIPYYFINH